LQRFRIQKLLGIITRTSSSRTALSGKSASICKSSFIYFWLQSLTMITTLFITQQFMKVINASFAIGNGQILFEFEFIRQHVKPTTMKTNTAQYFQCDGKKP
jgi:hypothetical protein